MQTTEIRDLEFYRNRNKERKIDLENMYEVIQEVELTTEDVNTEIKERESKLLEEAKAEYESLGKELDKAHVKLSAAKAVLADRRSVLRELKDTEYWPNGYTNSAEEVPETIIDTPIEVEEVSNVSKETGIYKIDSTASSILPETIEAARSALSSSGTVDVIVEANSIYMIADYEFRVPAEGESFDWRTINKIIKRLRMLPTVDERIKVLEDLSRFISTSSSQKILDSGLLKESKETGEPVELVSTLSEDEEIDSEFEEVQDRDLTSSTSDEGWFLDDWEKE